ncbi:hypothetical protein BGX28_006554 [Mortierella sp. GBA30]|nr:hypothetical protein BGX28_006554 [Mortierella sp. GBA30]
MEASDLINYKEQVATIDAALLADPTNEELLTLKAELLELITLTETLLQQEAAAATAPTATTKTASSSPSPYPSAQSPQSSSASGLSTPSITKTTTSTTTTAKSPPASNQPIYQPPPPVAAPRNWSVGDRCRALFADDGKFYEAKILAVGGGGQVYTVAFKGYESSPPALVGPQDLKAIYDAKKHHHHKQHDNKSGATETSGDGDGDKKDQRKRGPDAGADGGGLKKKKSASEQVQKQMAWQNFAKGGAKKAKGPILKKSIFATPDDPEGKVGVVGSGKGMTQFQQRGKHIYGNSPQSH